MDFINSLSKLKYLFSLRRSNLNFLKVKKSYNNINEKREIMNALQKDTFLITDEELLSRAKNILKSARINDTDGVIDIFANISLPFDKENYKKRLFKQIFELAEIEYEWSVTFGFVIYSENRTTKTVVSHIDLIPKFNKGFRENKVYKIEDNKLIGALDNTFTNAVLINHILNNRDKNTTYLFTLDEETKQHAMRDYMKAYGNEQFIINLDVTNDGWFNNMSVEYDEPCWEICKQINDNMDSPFLTTDRVGDDFDEVIKAEGKGFSYCIPTKKVIHSYNNYTLIEKIKPYMDGLDYMIKKMSIQEYKPNINYLSIDKAIKCKSRKELKEKDIKKVITSKKPKYQQNEYVVEFIDNKRNKNIETASDLIIDISMDNNFFKESVITFLLDIEAGGSFFTYDYFINFFNDELFYELFELDLIKVAHIDKFEFNTLIVNKTEFKIYKELSKIKTLNASKFFIYMYKEGKKSFIAQDLQKFEKNNSVLKASKGINILLEKKYIKTLSAGLYRIITTSPE